jgi:hypothetical protein
VNPDLPGATPTPQQQELESILRGWLGPSSVLIWRRLEDAAARASAGRLPTAEARVLELGGELVRRIGDARGHFYWSAFDLHRRGGLDPAIHDLNVSPDRDGEQVARTARVFGRDPRIEIVDLHDDARAALQSAALADERPSVEPSSWLENWRTEFTNRITGTVHRMLSDSQIALFEAVGQILVKPEFR